MKGLAATFLFIIGYVLQFGSLLMSILSNSLASPRVWYRRRLWKASAKILLCAVCVLQLGAMLVAPLFGSVTLIFIVPVIGYIIGPENNVLYGLIAGSAIVSLVAAPKPCVLPTDQKLMQTMFLLLMWSIFALCWRISRKSAMAVAILCGTSIAITFVCLSVTGSMIIKYKQAFSFPGFCLYFAQSVAAVFASAPSFPKLIGGSWRSTVSCLGSSILWVFAWMVFISGAFKESGNVMICFASVSCAMVLVGKALGSIASAVSLHGEEMRMNGVPEFEEVYDDDGLA